MAENQEEDPPGIARKLHFLQNNEVPRRLLGHAANFTDFAKCLGIRRETFRDQIDRKVLPTETQSLLAEKLSFRVNWSEWSSGDASAFERRYFEEHRHLMESLRLSPKADAQPFENASGGQKEEPVRPAHRNAWGYGGILMAVGVAIFLFWWLHPNPLPYISHVELFDESKGIIIPGSDANGARPRHTLTALEERSGNDFLIESAERFFFASGFVLAPSRDLAGWWHEGQSFRRRIVK